MATSCARLPAGRRTARRPTVAGLASMPARKLRSLRYTQRLRTMSSTLSPLLLWKAISCTPHVGTAGEAAVRDRLTRRRAIRVDVAFQHRHEPLAVGRIAGLDHQIENQAAPA